MMLLSQMDRVQFLSIRTLTTFLRSQSLQVMVMITNLSKIDKSIFKSFQLHYCSWFKKIFIFLLIVFISPVLSSCENNSQTEVALFPDLSGSFITNDLANKLEATLSANRDLTSVKLASGGGYSQAGDKIAWLLYERDITLRIDRFCFSACADYILLGANKVEIVSEYGLIGVHGTPMWLFYDTLNPEQSKNNPCYRKSMSEKSMAILIKERGKGKEFILESYKRLKPKITSEHSNDKCQFVNVELSVDAWFPTRQQILDYTGIEVTGELCADHPECINNTLQHNFINGSVIMFGDETYVVKNKITKQNADRKNVIGQVPVQFFRTEE